MRSRVVQPEQVVLRLSRGDTLTVKKRINAGERRAMFALMRPKGEYEPTLAGISACVTYLLDWSVVDPSGNLLVIRDRPANEVRAALDSLDPPFYDEIETAITQHHADMRAEIDELKNDRDGAMTLPGISPSLDALAAPSETSANLTPTSTT